ncbi:MAG: UvrD-helicase domain-containing protein [Deltaproteobacteria bacterium]|nr:UvrD-helicase domain-containing protein [Deltaproteobacteria bacterium]
MDYPQAQRAAIDVLDRNFQIIACAGSGKTRVVAARVVNIVRQGAANGIAPENTVAFTFTDKAAAELKDRITRVYQAEFGHVQGLAGMYVGTIHGFASTSCSGTRLRATLRPPRRSHRDSQP